MTVPSQTLEERLRAIQELLTKATPRPWIEPLGRSENSADDSGPYLCAMVDGELRHVGRFDYADNQHADKRLIKATVNALPDLLAELDRLEKLVEEAREALKSMETAYVSTLNKGYHRIRDLGGDCDTVDVMEASDPALAAARSLLSRMNKETKP